MEEFSGRAGREGPPEDGLASKAKADTKAADWESEEEGPLLIFGEEDVLVVLEDT